MDDSIKEGIQQPSKRGGLLSSQYDNVPDLKLLNSSVIADYNEVRAEAFPLSRGGHYDAVMAYFKCGDPNYDPNNKSVQKVSLTSLLSYSSFGERWWMALGVVLATISGLGIPAWLLLLAKSLNTFSNLALLSQNLGGKSLEEYLRSELLSLCIAFVVVGAVVMVAGTGYVSIWTYTGEKQALRIQKAFVRASLNQDAKWFDSHDRDALPTKMGTALLHINNAIGKQVVDVYSNAISAIGCLIVALMLNTALSLVMLCVVPVVLIVMALFNICIRRVKKRANANIAQAGGIATEVLSGIKTVAALCAQPYFRREYEHHIQESAKYSIRSIILSSALSGITGAMFYITYVFAFYIGTEQVVSGASMVKIIICFISGEPQCRITGAAVMCCIYGVILCVTFFGLMGPGLSIINLGRTAAVAVFDVLKRVPPINPSSDKGKKLERGVQGKIEFRDIVFSYGDNTGKPIFYKFNLTINEGQSVALVGPSGSGKSTIARLLLRFYDPNVGDVIIDDNHTLTSINVSWWRQQIGYVAQEPILFPGTIRENIALGKPQNSSNPPTDEEIIAAAEMACADEFIKNLPDGYDTVVGSTTQLSGGQMQRICIARALLRDPIILVLDEATSALDQLSEQHVQEALKNIRRKKKITTVTIAHRLTTILDSDSIAVIADGKIAELGDHATLLHKEAGIYRSLCQSQGILPNEKQETEPSDDLAGNSFFSTHNSAHDNNREAVAYPSGNDEIAMIQPDRANPIKTSYFPETVIQPPSNNEIKGKVEVMSASTTNDSKIGDQTKRFNIQEPQMAERENDGENDESTQVEMAPMSTVWSYVGSDVVYTAIGLIGSGIVGALSPCESILTAEIVNTFYTQDAENMVEYNLQFISKFFYFALGSLVGNLMVGVGLSRSGCNLGARVRTVAFRAMLQRSMGWFDHPDNTTGELTTILGAGAEAVEGLTGLPLGFRIRALTSIVTGVAISLSYSLRIGLVSVACVPFIMFAGVMQVCCMRKNYSSSLDGLSPATIMEQGLRGITSVQAYGLEGKVGNDYEKALEPESSGKMRRGAIAGFVFGFTQMSVFVSFALVFYSGVQLLSSFDILFVDFFTAVLSVMFGALGASQVSSDFNSRQRGRVSAARILSVLEGPTDRSEDESGAVMNVEGAMKFEKVEFAYPSRMDNAIFYISPDRDGADIDVAKKESIAFVGRSGSGKSTILQIVMRFYDITGGSAKLDGHEFSDINVNHLRKNIGYVGQLPTLFNGTVRQNILLGKEGATDDEIQEAAKAANAFDFISNLPDGFDTSVGPGGNLLSGGQKQRIAIARAIIGSPKILVLDEATAALDNESQKMVQIALDELHAKQPRTTLTVAHRLLTVKNCDKIFFMGEGGVLESGSHSELLALKGHYYNLWIMQGGNKDQDYK
mmetsp:Transcript_2573/g.6073  ORF Transcript_2573/g.6073 Transcript_2573/m.6073 type:complete len:1406 (-) Transcript_2573:56-4273(-)